MSEEVGHKYRPRFCILSVMEQGNNLAYFTIVHHGLLAHERDSRSDAPVHSPDRGIGRNPTEDSIPIGVVVNIRELFSLSMTKYDYLYLKFSWK